MSDNWHKRQVDIETQKYKMHLSKIIDECPFQFNHIYKITENKKGIPYPINGTFYFKGVCPVAGRPYMWSLKKNSYDMTTFTSTTRLHWEEVTETDMT